MIFFLLVAVLVSSASAMPLNDLQYLHNISLKYDGANLQNLDSIDNLSDVPAGMAQSLKDAIQAALPSYLDEVKKEGNLKTATTASPNHSTVQSGSSTAQAVSSTAQSGGSSTAQSGGSSTTRSMSSTAAASTIMPPLHQYPAGNEETHDDEHDDYADHGDDHNDHDDNHDDHNDNHDDDLAHNDDHNTTNNGLQALKDFTASVGSKSSQTPPLESTTHSPLATTTDFWSRTDLVHFHVDIDMPDDATMIPLDGPLPH